MGVHLAQGVGQVRDLGHVVPDAVVHALDVIAVAGALEEDVVQLAVVHGRRIPVARLELVAVAVAVERQAEVHHLVRDLLLPVEDVRRAAGARDGAPVQRRIVVRRVALVVGHHVDVVDVRQHAVVVGVLAAVGRRIGEDLVGHRFAHLLEERDEVLPVRGAGAVHVVAVLGRIGGIFPVDVESVDTVRVADVHAFVHESLALRGVAGHLGPAVGVLAPAAHLQLDLQLRVLRLVGDELLHQRDGLRVDLDAHAVVLVHEAHVAHVDVGEVAHLVDGREQVGAGVLGVVDLDDRGLAEAGEALGVVHPHVGRIRGIDRPGGRRIGVEGIPGRDLARVGLGVGIRTAIPIRSSVHPWAANRPRSTDRNNMRDVFLMAREAYSATQRTEPPRARTLPWLRNATPSSV